MAADVADQREQHQRQPGGEDGLPAATITAFIVQVALGDLPHGSVGYQTIFAAGLTLMLFTLACNIAGHMLRKTFREAY